MSAMRDTTRILDRLQAGDAAASADLLPLVYDELRRLASGHMANEAPGHTLDATALVHEAYQLRVFGGLSVEEAGEALGMARATAFRSWSYARAWLTAALADGS